MVITNCGNTASGKSCFSTAIASRLLDLKKATCIIIDFNTDIPAKAIWEPTERTSPNYSLGTLFEAKEKIDVKTLPKYLLTHNKYKNLGLLGYCSGDTALSYSEPTHDQFIDVIKAAEQMVDYVIIDCSSPMFTEALTASIEMADCLNILLTPDLKGIVYHQTANKLYGDIPKFHVENTNYILSPVKNFNDINTISENLNMKFLQLPYSTEIEVALCEGKMFDIYKKAPRKYKNTVDKIIENL